MPLTNRLLLAVVAVAVLSQGPVAAQGGWQTVTNEQGRFSVTVPGPLSTKGPTTDADGIVTTTFTFRQGDKVYVLTYSNTPSDKSRAEMDAARDGVLGGLKMTLVSQHHFKSAQPVGDIEATEFTGREPGTGRECKARVFWLKSRMYIIGVVNNPGTGSSLDTDKFLDSFRIRS